MPRGRNSNPRQYPRTARLNELCREILADELTRIDDPRLELVTVIHVDVDPDLSRATVDVSSLGEDEEGALEALGEQRAALQRAIGRQARMKRTPELSFRRDEVIARAARIEELLARERAERESRPVVEEPDDDGGGG
jgi:ribosome-binding factor A